MVDKSDLKSGAFERVGSNPTSSIDNFCGRKIFDVAGYPAVYWPNHPLRWPSNGCVRVHQVVAYEKYGEIPDGMQVHHIDEDKWNWDPDNLILVTSEVHNRLHASAPEERLCPTCGKMVLVSMNRREKRSKTYCGLSCANTARYNIPWPPVVDVQKMATELGYAAAGRQLGCSDNAVRKYLRRK